jgi:adenine deaminase
MLNTYTVNSLRELVYTAEGRRKASLVITNTKLVNVLTHEIEGVDIAVQGDRIGCALFSMELWHNLFNLAS